MKAEALLAGMMVDTNGFCSKDRSKELSQAAAWLRRQGADPTEVSRFFQEDRESFTIKAEAMAGAIYHEGGIMTSICGRAAS